MKIKADKNEMWLRKCVSLAVVAGVSLGGVAEASEIVNIDSNVNATVYGNGSGENHTIKPPSSSINDNIDGIEVNISENGSVHNVFGAYKENLPVWDTEYTGWDTEYKLTNNSININNGTVEDSMIIAAYSTHGYGTVSKNHVIINGVNVNDISPFVLQIKGALISSGGGNANDNEVVVKNTNITTTNEYSDIAGAYIDVFAKGDGTAYGKVSDNSVVIDSSNVDMVDGGYIYVSNYSLSSIPETESIVNKIDVQANNNSILLSGNTSVAGGVDGGEIQSRGIKNEAADRKFTATADGNVITIRDNVIVNGNITAICAGHIAADDVSNTLSVEATNNLSASNNTIDISGGTIHAGIRAGDVGTDGTISGKTNIFADYNKVKISGNAIIDYTVCGGAAWDEGHSNSDIKVSSSNNSIMISGGSINDAVFGARAAVGNYNIDSISSSSVDINVSDNYVMISGGNIAESVFGGFVDELVMGNNNTVNVNVTGNKIEVNGGKINGDVTVGQIGYENIATAHYTVKDNNLIWRDGIINGWIMGDGITGYTDGALGWNADHTNSSFDFYASSSNSNKTISGIYNFKNYNFYIDNTVPAGSTLINVNSPVDLSKSNIGIGMTSDAVLKIGDSVKLLATQGLTTKSNLINDPTHMEGYNGGFGRANGENIYDVYDFTLTNDGYNLNAIVGSRSSNPKSEEIPASRQPEVALIDDKLDIVDTAYHFSVDKSEPVIYTDFNYTDVKKGDLILRGSENVIGSALTKGDEEKKNTITQGPFIEYGDGSFGGKNFYSTGGVEGSGKNKKYGAGYLFRQVKNGRHHYDAYVRAGKINNEFRSYMVGVGNVDYDNSDVYYAAHFGYGQYTPIDPHTTMDVYGKYFYKILPGSSTTTHVSTGGDINTEFDALTSHKFRIGSKITWDYMEEKKKMMFADLALEHELSHTQTSRLGDRVISNSSGADTTAVMEVGYRQVFGPKDAFLFTADLQGYVGTRTGFGGNIGVRFNF